MKILCEDGFDRFDNYEMSDDEIADVKANLAQKKYDAQHRNFADTYAKKQQSEVDAKNKADYLKYLLNQYEQSKTTTNKNGQVTSSELEKTNKLALEVFKTMSNANSAEIIKDAFGSSSYVSKLLDAFGEKAAVSTNNEFTKLLNNTNLLKKYVNDRNDSKQNNLMTIYNAYVDGENVSDEETLEKVLNDDNSKENDEVVGSIENLQADLLKTASLIRDNYSLNIAKGMLKDISNSLNADNTR